MKKFLAMLIAVTAILSTLTSCGNDEPESSSDSVSEVSESTTENKDESSETETESPTTEDVKTTTTEKSTTTTTAKTTTVEITQAVTTENDETTTQENTDISENPVNETEVDDSEYIAAMKNLLNSLKDSDTTKALESSIPKSTFDAMKKAEMLDFIIEQIGASEATFGQFQNIDDLEIEIVSVKAAEPGYIETAAKTYSAFEGMCNTLTDAGLTYNMFVNEELPEDMTDEELVEVSEKLVSYTNQTDVDITVDFVFYNLVTFSVNGNEAEYPVFKTAGDIAKVDLMMTGSSAKNN